MSDLYKNITSKEKMTSEHKMHLMQLISRGINNFNALVTHQNLFDSSNERTAALNFLKYLMDNRFYSNSVYVAHTDTQILKSFPNALKHFNRAIFTGNRLEAKKIWEEQGGARSAFLNYIKFLSSDATTE